MTGRESLTKALQSLKSKGDGQSTRPPLQLQPTTPFEALVAARLAAIETEISELKDQNKWLQRLVGGAVVTALLDLVIK